MKIQNNLYFLMQSPITESLRLIHISRFKTHIKAVSKTLINWLQCKFPMNKDLPQHDHEDGCNGTEYRIHRTRSACSRHSWERRVAPGTIRCSSAPIATFVLQFNQKSQQNPNHTPTLP